MYLPQYHRNNMSLALRLLKTRNRSAYEAMAHTILGITLSPLDKQWQRLELARYARFSKPRKPLLIFIGPPRSGTTLLAQAAVAVSNSAYFNNLTSIFPRSPIEANAKLRRLLKSPEKNFRFYYGKTTGLNGFNDGLYLWDRWLGNDRRAVPAEIKKTSAVEMNRFFAAYEAFYDKPVICKINRLDCCANLVAEALAGAKFVCLQRAPVNLANSLYRAREDIMGNLNIPYGTDFRRYVKGNTSDPIKDVAAQVRFHYQTACRQRELIGPDRFRFVRYEDFCRNPRETMKALLTWGLDAKHPGFELENLPDRFRISKSAGTDSPNIRFLTRELADESKFYASGDVMPGGGCNC